MLVAGSSFTKHGLKGINRRHVKCTATHIHWLKRQESPLEECVDPISWDSISEILQGKQTLMFSRARAKGVEDSRCLSIVYRSDNRSLDLVADTDAQAFEWYGAMNGYLQELKERFAARAQGRDAFADQELESVRRALETEREQHKRAKSELEDQKQKTLEELDKVRQRRGSLIAKYESKETEMERMKAMMKEERDQLVTRVNDLHSKIKELTGQLDSALTQNQELLVQLQEARKDQSELQLLRDESKRVRESRASQAAAISEVLNLFNSKFNSFHDSLQGGGSGAPPSLQINLVAPSSASSPVPGIAPAATPRK